MAFNIKGETDASFAAVEEAFSRNFEDQGEVGAALCIYRGDRPVVDLWGDSRTLQRPSHGNGTRWYASTR